MTISFAQAEPQFWGLAVSHRLNAASILVGALVAVSVAAYISPKLAAASARRDSKERLLRTLINTWQTPANPDYHSAIGLIPLDFKGNERVLDLRNALLASVNQSLGTTDEEIAAQSKQNSDLAADLIAEIAHELDFDLTKESLVNGAYIAKGFVDRENLILGALFAWPRIAHALERNNALFEATLASPPSKPDGSDDGVPADGAPQR